MSTRSFIALAVSVMVVGGILGGLFIGGYELGKRNAPAQDLAMADLAMLPSPGGGAVLTAEGVPDEAMLSQKSGRLWAPASCRATLDKEAAGCSDLRERLEEELPAGECSVR